MNKPQSNNRRSRFVIQIVLGSTAKAIVARIDALAARSHTDVSWPLLRLAIDYTESSPADLAPSTIIQAPAGCIFFIAPAKPADASSIRQAVEEGLIVAAAEGWGQKSRGTQEDEGAGGKPREGSEKVRVNSHKIREKLIRLIQEAIACERRSAEIAKGHDLGSDIGCVTIEIFTSTVGGMGTGSLIWLITECIAPCLRANGVEGKIVLRLLTLGTLQTHDTSLAKTNEATTLRTLRALATGAYVDALTGTIMPVPFEHICLSSNISLHGNLTSLKALVAEQAHLVNLIWRSPAGSDLREREVDIAGWQSDAFEDPRCVYTACTAMIHWNRQRLLDCCGYMAAKTFVATLSQEADDERICADATAFANSCNLIESQDQNQLTAIVYRPDEFAGEPVSARIDQSLTDRVSGTRGYARILALADSVTSIRNSDVPSVWEPSMRGKAQAVIAATEESLSRHANQILQRSRGLSETTRFLQFVLLILERSQQAIAEKIAELQEMLASHEQVLADIAEQLQQLSQRSWLRRSVAFQLVRTIGVALEQSGRAAINYQLQIAACTIAIETILVPLTDLIQRKLARLVSCRQRLVEVAQHCGNAASSRANEPTVFDVPIGIELVTPKYIDGWFTEHVTHSGGQEQFVAVLRSLFLQQRTSFAALIDASFQEMEEIFTSLCRSVFEPAAATTNVLAEFRRVYPSARTQQRILAELIGQSEGRLLTEGEVNKIIAWVKTANVPNPEDAEWIRKALENADHKAGKWQVAAHPTDPETFSMIQMRGDISLTPIIDRSDLPDTYETWKRIIPTAADPVSAIAVGPNPTDRQFRRVLAKAIAAGLLTTEGNGCFAFRSSTGEQRLLGEDTATVSTAIQPAWRQLLYAESYFASQLVDSESQVIVALERMKAELAAKETSSDKRLQLIDVLAIDECIQQATLLRPWARRIQRARRRIVS